MREGQELDQELDEELDQFHEPGDDVQLRILLTEAAPEFPVTVALGDRALAGAARRRARVRGLGGLGAVALVAVGAVAVAPLAGWGSGGRGAGVAPGRFLAGSVNTTASTSMPPPVRLPSSSPSPSASQPSQPSPVSTASSDAAGSSDPVSVSEAKVEAATRVTNALQSSHQNAFMGAVVPMGQPDASPIVVYRKPVPDPTLEHDAQKAAAPYTVVFRDSVLNRSEQWFLGHRMQDDMGYWKAQNVQFATALQDNGTITIFAAAPAKVIPLLEEHYGYDGRVFVGQVWSFGPLGGNSTGG